MYGLVVVDYEPDWSRALTKGDQASGMTGLNMLVIDDSYEQHLSMNRR